MSMILHCGAVEATFDELKIPVLPEEHPKYRDNKTYRTVPHHQLIGLIRALVRELVSPNAIVKEQFALNGGKAYPGAKMFALMQIDPDAQPTEEMLEIGSQGIEDSLNRIENADPGIQDAYPVDGDEAPVNVVDEPADVAVQIIEEDKITPSLAIRNSYDRSMSIAGGLGYNCFICDNLALSGEIMFSRKHTINAMGDVIGTFTQLLSTLGAQHQFDQEFREASKKVELTNDRGFEILGYMAGMGLLPFENGTKSAFAMAIEEWKRPTFPIFEDRNLWSLFNAVTRGQGRHAIQDRLESSSAASRIFRDLLGPEWNQKAEEICMGYAHATRLRGVKVGA